MTYPPLVLLSKFLPLHAVYYTFLTVRIIRLRRALLYPVGDGMAAAKEALEKGDKARSSQFNKLSKAVRAHGNFAEQVPLSLIALLTLELNGASSTTVRNLHIVLFLTRLIHGELGMMKKHAYGVGRPVGVTLQTVLLLGAAIYNAVLTWGIAPRG